jgi:hypothetical protein
MHPDPSRYQRSRRAMEKIGAVLSHEAPKEINGVLQDYVFYKILAPAL